MRVRNGSDAEKIILAQLLVMLGLLAFWLMYVVG